jgi:type IV secretory pathway ATPase VirB11/archaellum biosynthesis ATPase
LGDLVTLALRQKPKYIIVGNFCQWVMETLF